MEEKQFTNLVQALLAASPSFMRSQYVVPDIETIEVEISQNILGSGSVPDLDPEDW